MLELVTTAKAARRLRWPWLKGEGEVERSAPREQRTPVRKQTRWARRLVLILACIALGGVLLGWGVKHTTWLGPKIADGMRSVLGTDEVERIERFVATARDRTKSIFARHRKPRSFTEMESEPAAPAETRPRVAEQTSKPVPLSPFLPRDVGPMYPAVAAPGDGVWQPLHTAQATGDAPLIFATMLHPDRKRSWSELFVFAMDLRRLRLHVVAGTEEPLGSTPEAANYARSGLIAPDDLSHIVVAMNGGFKAEHGHHGMRVDGVTLLPPRDHLCTIAAYNNGSIRIGTWRSLAETAADMVWWRQAAPCMYEAGKLHPGLLVERNRNWGAALEGEVAIPRSAIGVDTERTTLYFSLSNDTTPRVIADGMRYAGATDVAQLDVNWPYPRFVVFRPDKSGKLNAAGVVKGVLFEPDDYIRKPARRDFFYVTYAPTGGD